MEKRGDVNVAYTPGATSPSNGKTPEDVSVKPDPIDRLKVAAVPAKKCCGGKACKTDQK